MLTRRTFLTTIAAAPLARFCKTEPVRGYAIEGAKFTFARIPLSSGVRIVGTIHKSTRGPLTLMSYHDHDTDIITDGLYRDGRLVCESQRPFTPGFHRTAGPTPKPIAEFLYALPQGTLG